MDEVFDYIRRIIPATETMFLTPSSSGGGGGDSAAATNFLARTSGLDATHTNAYKAFLNGLTTDGLFNSDGTTNFFDCLYIFATQDEPTGKLNLVSNIFNCSASAGTPTFTADQGYSYPDDTALNTTNFNAFTASSPKYTQDSAHMSVWNYSSVENTIAMITVGAGVNLFAFTDHNFYSRVNDAIQSGGYADGGAVAGHFVGNRSSNTAIQGYQNGNSLGSASQASQAVLNGEFFVPAVTNKTQTISAASIGASLSATNVTNFYNRIRSYMTAVGVP